MVVYYTGHGNRISVVVLLYSRIHMGYYQSDKFLVKVKKMNFEYKEKEMNGGVHYEVILKHFGVEE